MKFKSLLLLNIFVWGTLAFGVSTGPVVTNCGNQAACNDFNVVATGGVLFQHHDQSHDGNGNLTSINNEAISTSSATGFTSPVVVNSGTFRNKAYCDTTGVLCPVGTNLGQLQIGTGLPTNSQFNVPQNTTYFPDIFDTVSANCPGSPPLLFPTNAPCGSYVFVATNGACAKFKTDPTYGILVSNCPGASGRVTNDWCASDGSSPCTFIGRFKTGTLISFQTQPDGTSVLSGTVSGLIPFPGKANNYYQVSCSFNLITAPDFASWTNGHESVQLVTINSCN